MFSRTVTLDNMNQNIKNMKYASRGALTVRVKEIEQELRKGFPKPFREVVKLDVGDCQAMGQKPLTFLRQVLALCAYPEMMKDGHFPADVKYRAEAILNSCSGKSVGSYTESTGLDVVKKHIAEYIQRRDGVSSDPQNIILSAGASEAIERVLCLLNHSDGWKPVGVMLPVPRFPVHSAILAEYGMQQIGYYLDEDQDWALNIKELYRVLKEARKVCQPRAIIIVNPGNPTGSVLSRKCIEEIIKFAYREKLFLMADEVYQDNVYAEDAKFYSFKKVMTEMGAPYKDTELASFMSASKGYMGECGLRGGYCEVVNIDPDVRSMLYKATAARLCTNVLGQATMDCIVNPPRKGEPSYNLFVKERERVLRSLKERAALVTKMINNIPGMKCSRIAGAMYAFPRIFLPQRAIEKAQSLGQSPDFFYAMQLLENTGIHVLPGSGFGQIPGTYHLRITILPQMEKLKDTLQRLEEYHLKFLLEYQ